MSLTAVLTSFYREQAGSSPDSAPALLAFVQRFGSSINLHIHWHLVVSDGTFALEDGRLRFRPAPPGGPGRGVSRASSRSTRCFAPLAAWN
ncbi:MAG: transposase [Elusimicrobia bacterium]|nr:transposase [Elusimicrobiota bacterium]